MSRLYLKIYLAMLATLLAFLLLSTWLLWATEGPRRGRDFLLGTAALAEGALPPPEAGAAALEARLVELASQLGGGLGVFSAEGRELASAGPFVPAPDPARRESHWLRGRHRAPSSAAVRLGDGRWLVLGLPGAPPHRGPGAWWLGMVLLGLLLAACAWPVARSITRRLERVDERVNALADGDLGARAPVEGHDEVARLARSVNRAAERIETLVGAQRTLLASASHELRSPLTRIRMAAELLGDGASAEARARLERDVALLDDAVDELLLASRLELADATASYQPVDLLALAAEEAARVDAEARGEPVSIRGDRRSLRHLLRNLLANARRHAPGAPPEVEVTATPEGARLVVEDRGPGVPAEERERVFEPFVRGASAASGGSGLGLALVRHIARHHGGDARCLAREGGGSRFEVTLPREGPRAGVGERRARRP